MNDPKPTNVTTAAMVLAFEPAEVEVQPLRSSSPNRRTILLGVVGLCALCLMGSILYATNPQFAPASTKAAIGCGTTVTGSNVGAPNSRGQASGDVNFDLVVGVRSTFTFDTCTGSNFDTYLHVFNAQNVEVGSNDDSCGLQSRLTVTLDPGSYVVVVDGFATSAGSFSLSVTCGLACGATVGGSTAGLPNTFGNAAGDAVYTFTLSSASTISLSTCGSTFDTFLRLYQSDRTTQIASNDDSCSLQSQLSNIALAAGTYVAVVDGFSSSTGNYQLSLTCVSPSPSPTPAPAPQAAIACGSVVSGSTRNAPNTVGNPAGDVSFNLVVGSVATSVTLSTCGSNFDTFLRVFDQSNTQISANDDSTCNGQNSLQSNLALTLNPGTYKVVVDGFGSSTGDFRLTTSCSLACGGRASGSTVRVPNTVGNTAGDATFTFTSAGGPATFSTCGSSFDTFLRVFDASDNQISFNDDSSCNGSAGLQSNVATTLAAGTYKVVVDGFSTSEGNYVVSANC
eukprot:c45493_g1_i1.p1 GENE.c45493_g1_i1~~c45493_g1_i1.p1  ORF type:complete len:538 (+),score=105.38 c45493_g1_i1:85-1614(+)